MISNPVVWFEIYVQDMEQAKAFYEAVLAIKLEKMTAPTEIIGVRVKIKDLGKNSLLSSLLHAAHLVIKKQPGNGPK